ncbi:MAG: hypothetical protein AB9835_09755 [Eubacteriales bacterium]
MRVVKAAIFCLLPSLLLWSCAPASTVDDITERLMDTQEYSVDDGFSDSDPPTAGESLNAEQELEKKLHEFLDALVSGDKEKLIQFGGVKSPAAYGFWEGTDVAGYKILRSSPCERIGREETFEVELDIRSSSHELFPVGKSVWNITTMYSESGYFEPIRPADVPYKDIKMITFSKDDFSDAVNFCYYFTVELDYYLNLLPNSRTCGDFNQITPDIARKDTASTSYTEEDREAVTWFSTMMWRFIQKVSPVVTKDTYMDMAWIEQRAEEILGITNADYIRSSAYDPSTGKLGERYLGGNWKFGFLVSEEKDDAGNTVIVIDWYADTLMIAHACTLRYTLYPTQDSFRLFQVEELFNTGHTIASGST